METKEGSFENIKYPEIASEIREMVNIDQDMREKSLKDGEYWDAEVDKKNTERMKEIVSEVGWPTISKVGKEESANAWLLVQHSDHDPVFQRMCVELMKQEPEDEVAPHDIAYLEDRILLKETGYQKYGTQFQQIEGKFIPLPIQAPETVEERRREMSLDTLEENIQRMYRKYQIEDDE